MVKRKNNATCGIIILLLIAFATFFVSAATISPFTPEIAFAAQSNENETFDILDTLTFFYQGTTNRVVEFNIYNDVYDKNAPSLIPKEYPAANPYVNDQENTLNNCDLGNYFYLNGKSVRETINANSKGTTNYKHSNISPLNQGGVYAPIAIQVLTYESRINVKVMLDESETFTISLKPGFTWVNKDSVVLTLSEEIKYQYKDGKLIKQFEKEEIVDIAACTNNSGKSIQVRTGNAGMDSDGNITEWFGDRYLFFFLPVDKYNTFMPDSEWRNNYLKVNDLSGYNILDKIELDTWEGETLKLGDIVNITDIQYNKWGEIGAIAFNIGSTDESNPYGGTSFSAIRILEGCEFPDFKSTNGPGNVIKKYVQISTIQVTYEHVIGVVPNFNTNWSVNTEMGYTAGVSDVDYGKNENYLTLYLRNVSDYSLSGEQKTCGYESDDFFGKYVYVNGISLYELGLKAEETQVSRMGSKNGIASFSVPVPSYENGSEVKEIIIQKGCRIPSYYNNERGVSVYGENYYTIKDTVTFVKNGAGEFEVKSGKTEWTVTFDGANPVKVKDYGRLGEKDIPEGAEKQGYIFVGWYNGILKLSANTQITEGVNFTSKYIKAYIVTFDYGTGKKETVTVGKNSKLTMPSDEKSGYTVVGWHTEDGELYNFEKNVRADMTLYAVWKKTGSSGGCSGDILGLGIMAGVAVMAAACSLVVIFIRRKRV